MIKYFETFAGIGAFRSAFEKVGGFECIGWCKIDRFTQQAYRALYDTGGEKFYEDITKIEHGARAGIFAAIFIRPKYTTR